jgi:ABC-type glycerol-3-phosphate transport system substrate-binding protein
MLRNILLGLGLFATVFSMLIFSCKIPVGSCKAGNGAKGDVILWGTLPEGPMNAVTQAFNPQAKSYAVRYRYVPEAQFNQKLLEALASGTGPDLIMAPYQTILSQSDRVYPFPTASMGEKAFKDTFVDGASVFYTQAGALALPVSVEPMVLFYNRTLFSKHGILNPPSYWDELTTMAPSLTIKNGNTFLESAVALGTPGTAYAKDIIMAIVTQLGQTPVVSVPTQLGQSYFDVQVNTPISEGGEVLPLATTNRYFTQFGDPGQKAYTWSDTFGDAVDVFVSEKLAMYIGYSGELNTLRARNPRASIEMTYLPQTRGYNTFSTGMRMYGIATLKSTKNPVAALTVESQFSGAGVAPTISAIVGGVPALRAYAGSQGLDPVVARSMLVARGWYDSHEDESSAYVASMISDIINYRYGVNDASSIFVGRLRDLYSSNK